MDNRLEEVKAILKKYNQDHLLNHYNKLDDANKKLYFHKNRSNHMDDNFHILKDDYSSIKNHLEFSR